MSVTVPGLGASQVVNFKVVAIFIDVRLFEVDLHDSNAAVTILIAMASSVASLVLLSYRDAVLSFLFHDEANQSIGARFMRALHEAVMVVIVHFTNLNSTEVLLHVFEAHPEATISGVLREADLLLEL
eukprot:CAMPEP_0170488634 /NCGR_PEP_ID=MMETSP0208-20121228/7142_1 /TAXON_ID=197538 /ORGANISM="Strombidium inclinatum, Strain S3" /LENGTH=127 /DNA_ID=CAMNT_0010763265 /DNA_START=51 /DNA_END=434 /DNA_ORIENTATION=+